MGVMLKILELRKRIKDLNLKMTGENTFAGFKYYQLSDFLPQTIDICLEIGLYDRYTEENGIPTLTMIDIETNEKEVFQTSRANLEMFEFSKDVKEQKKVIGTKPLNIHDIGLVEQGIGSIDAYSMRYVYRNMLKLTEPDFIEIMAERNGLLQAIYQNVPQPYIKDMVQNKGKVKLENFTNEELREVWQLVLNKKKKQKEKNSEEVMINDK
ncbi:hypothetical protein ACWOBL_06055 [Gemella bergeri]